MEKQTESLDPQNWDEMREMGHRIVDDMIDYLKNVRERPIWNSIPNDFDQKFEDGLPQQEKSFEEIYDRIKKDVLSYPMGAIHPRFWGWVIGTGSIQGAFSDLIASTMNSNSGGGHHSANYVEQQVIDWSKEMLGFDPNASGILTSGGSMANLIGLTVARHHQVNHDIRKNGIDAHKLRYYTSKEAHSSIQKSIELLGIGYENLVKIPVDSNYRVYTEEMEKQIKLDIENGLQPVCIIGNLGTVNTGAVDDLEQLAGLAKKYELWFHIDGAFGAITAITPNFSHLSKGLEKADSIAFDFHKWMYVNYEVGCVLIKHQKSHYQSFSLTPEYLEHNDRGVHGGEIWFSDYGVELSRNFKALKVWTSLQEHGIEKYGRIVEQNILQARYLTELVEKNKYLELMAPTSMNIVCFRYNPNTELNRDELNQLNEEILLQLHEQAIAVPSYTKLQDNYMIRVAITNHRSTFEDFELLVNEIVRIGEEVVKKIMTV